MYHKWGKLPEFWTRIQNPEKQISSSRKLFISIAQLIASLKSSLRLIFRSMAASHPISSHLSAIDSGLKESSLNLNYTGEHRLYRNGKCWSCFSSSDVQVVHSSRQNRSNPELAKGYLQQRDVLWFFWFRQGIRCFVIFLILFNSIEFFKIKAKTLCAVRVRLFKHREFCQKFRWGFRLSPWPWVVHTF